MVDVESCKVFFALAVAQLVECSECFRKGLVFEYRPRDLRFLKEYQRHLFINPLPLLPLEICSRKLFKEVKVQMAQILVYGAKYYRYLSTVYLINKIRGSIPKVSVNGCENSAIKRNWCKI